MNRFASSLLATVVLGVALATPAMADLNDNLGSLTGANAKGYLDPLRTALSGTLNASIFQTGKVPKSGVKFTLGVNAMAVAFKDGDRTYLPTDPPGFTSTTPTRVPTIIGGGDAVPVAGQGGSSFSYPGGLNVDQFALAAPQLTIGNVAGTRATVRWVAVKLGEQLGKVELMGFGAQHSLSQYFKGLPVDVAVGGFYQTLKIGDGILDTKAMHFDVTASKDFHGPIGLQPYVGVGYDSFDMDIAYKSTGSTPVDIGVSFDKKTNAHLTLGVLVSMSLVHLQLEAFSAGNTGGSLGLTFGY